MEIKELLEEKNKLEMEILSFIQEKVNAFLEKANVGISGIRISLVDVSPFSGEKEMEISGVSVSLDI